mmetsp:Transcript_4/g.12  ORF Transcript_4/g.12 Transcript_4/m.12 type:complete len:152 (+) Transcript_4:120-575(+)
MFRLLALTARTAALSAPKPARTASTAPLAARTATLYGRGAADRRDLLRALALGAATARASVASAADPWAAAQPTRNRDAAASSWFAAGQGAATAAARDASRRKRDDAERDLAEMQRLEDQRLRRCEGEVQGFDDCFYLGTRPRHGAGPATW